MGPTDYSSSNTDNHRKDDQVRLSIFTPTFLDTSQYGSPI